MDYHSHVFVKRRGWEETLGNGLAEKDSGNGAMCFILTHIFMTTAHYILMNDRFAII